jgi:hypothetical protein
VQHAYALQELARRVNRVAVVGERAALIVAVRAEHGKQHIACEAVAPSLFGFEAFAQRVEVAPQVAHAYIQLVQLSLELLRQSLQSLHCAAQLLQLLDGLLQLAQARFRRRGLRRRRRVGRNSVNPLLQLADALVNYAVGASDCLRELGAGDLSVRLKAPVGEALQNAQAHQLANCLIRPVILGHIVHLRICA